MNDAKVKFNEKYDTYSSMIFKIAMTFMGNKADAEDIMQEVFIRLLYKSPEFKSCEHEKRWIICTASNLCRDCLKSYARKNSVCLEDVEGYLSVPFEYETADLLFSLKPEYRIVLYLMYYEGYSVREIAKMLCISQSCVKIRLKRGREQLKLDLKKEGLYEKA